ncbi:Crp/Fnr family transcriptional regulator [Methylocapsa acidiphila]|uniref:Crp/Fnr family transcriptional regulator n=1 Tax=Methylocapsa acidiphila TaxID=133552 RepID=UPI00040AF6AE|nr:Crp/Fnr family transcriptional regulator [Methylocapsa acidiphila]
MSSRDGQETRSSSLFLREDEREAGAPDLLANLAPDELRLLLNASSVLSFSAGQDVFRQGDPHQGMFIIRSGEVRTYYIGPSGREITLAYWSPGNFVGGPVIFGGGRHIWSGRAMRATQVLHVRGRELRRLMSTIPNLAIGLVEALEHKGKCYSAMIHMLGTRSASERLAQMLLLMAERDGRRTKAGVSIARTLTHDDMAKLVGATRQWITTTLERLESEGAIGIRRTRLVILDESRLRRFAGHVDEIGGAAPARRRDESMRVRSP